MRNPVSRWIPVFAATLIASSVCAQEADERIVFTNVDVFDGRTERLLIDTSVTVEGNLIGQIGQDVSRDGARVIDGGGRTLIPGLIDGHNHIMLPASPLDLAYSYHWGYTGALVAREAERMLMRGFTTLRDAGGPCYGIAEAIDSGIVPGPRIYCSGHFIGQTSGHFDFRLPNDTHPRERIDRNNFEREWAYIADGVPEVRAYSREVLRRGANAIEAQPRAVATRRPMTRWIRPTTVSTRFGRPLKPPKTGTPMSIVHAYTDESVMRALEGGVKSIDHGNLIQKDETMTRDQGTQVPSSIRSS